MRALLCYSSANIRSSYIFMLLAGKNDHVLLRFGGIENGDGCSFPERSEWIHYNAGKCQLRMARNSAVYYRR